MNRHRRPVYRAALAALGSHAEADEAAQDAFVLAWRRLDTFRGDASFRTWLLTIAWHQAINRRRAVLRWWKRTVPFEDEVMIRLKPDAGHAGDVPGEASPVLSYVVSGFGRTASSGSGSGANPGLTPEQLASGRELRRDIAKAIRALSPKLRDTLLLAQAGDYSYAEIAALVGAPIGTVKWRVAEARRLVKMQLQDLGHGELG